jgi:hypothetical protein
MILGAIFRACEGSSRARSDKLLVSEYLLEKI